MLKNVDDVQYFNENTPEKSLSKILPDILFKGSDYKIVDVVGHKLVTNNGGKIKIIDKLKNFSSTKLI